MLFSRENNVSRALRVYVFSDLEYVQFISSSRTNILSRFSFRSLSQALCADLRYWVVFFLFFFFLLFFFFTVILLLTCLILLCIFVFVLI